MLCRLLTIVVSAPAAVCASETASFALLIAWFVPLICVVNCWLIARPAASSAALLMRRPEDKRVKRLRQQRLRTVQIVLRDDRVDVRIEC